MSNERDEIRGCVNYTFFTKDFRGKANIFTYTLLKLFLNQPHECSNAFSMFIKSDDAETEIQTKMKIENRKEKKVHLSEIRVPVMMTWMELEWWREEMYICKRHTLEMIERSTVRLMTVPTEENRFIIVGWHDGFIWKRSELTFRSLDLLINLLSWNGN